MSYPTIELFENSSGKYPGQIATYIKNYPGNVFMDFIKDVYNKETGITLATAPELESVINRIQYELGMPDLAAKYEQARLEAVARSKAQFQQIIPNKFEEMISPIIPDIKPSPMPVPIPVIKSTNWLLYAGIAAVAYLIFLRK